MKFGESFVQRSVPEWAAFNLNYIGVKDFIKRRTSTNLAGPVDIPQQGKSRWEESDRALFELLRDQYDNITLFLRMKQGEIDRRRNSLKRQIAILQTYVDEKALTIDVVAGMQGRKYRKLTKETDALGDLIQKVARFASAQKIAIRKILKKYTKWTGSTALQTRMDVEVFSSNQLQTDYSDYLQQLAEQRIILTEELAVPMLRRQHVEQLAKQQQQQQQQNRIAATGTRSLISQINNSINKAPPAFDAAIMTVPYGEAAGSAMYWLHADNLDEAKALIQKYMKRNSSVSSTPLRTNSNESLRSPKSAALSVSNTASTIHMLFFDNARRFVKDKSVARPSKIALSAYWTCGRSAAVTLAGLSPSSSGEQTILLDREDLSITLNRDSGPKNHSKEAATIQKYLIEHRDVKPLAQVRAHRTRYLGTTNTADVANWATLDTSITVGAVDMQRLGEVQQYSQTSGAFPYAILHIRWEFARTPAVVRAFDESHLTYRVHDFTIEDMAIRTVQKDLPRPSWQPLLEKDITQLPLTNISDISNLNRLKTTNRMRVIPSDVSGTSSGPSSSEGRTDSVFSTTTRGRSSITSDETRAAAAVSSPMDSKATSSGKARKKRARILVPEPAPAPIRYWNEFDDGDSDVNPQDSYAIYLDPNEPAFPVISKAWRAMKSWWPLKSVAAEKESANERSPLLYDEESASIESSDSDSLVGEQQQQLRRSFVWGLIGGVSVTFLIGIAVLALCIVGLG